MVPSAWVMSWTRLFANPLCRKRKTELQPAGLITGASDCLWAATKTGPARNRCRRSRIRWSEDTYGELRLVADAQSLRP